MPGLRREELAHLAGVGLDYYVRLEQGRNTKVSEAVLDSVARVLRLDEVERVHLHNLARPPRLPRPLRTPPVTSAQPLLDSMPDTPAYVLGRRSRILAWNRAASAVLFDFDAIPDERRTLARLVFRDPDAHQIYGDWLTQARAVTAWLHLEVGRHAEDDGLGSLITELLSQSPAFRRIWAEQHVSQPPHSRLALLRQTFGGACAGLRVLRFGEDPDRLLITHVLGAGAGRPGRQSLKLPSSRQTRTNAAPPRYDHA
ncbi:helix-turn-helix transcriptional regulator [Streptomyces sp. NPDC057539]|uniref:helix-turn-helix transcriptional regulator n=1 Tax=Streptomyces sp. NPDC057539 TaxID=3346159 RepID=UPI0036CC9ABA